jgi:hypothetical protein
MGPRSDLVVPVPVAPSTTVSGFASFPSVHPSGYQNLLLQRAHAGQVQQEQLRLLQQALVKAHRVPPGFLAWSALLGGDAPQLPEGYGSWPSWWPCCFAPSFSHTRTSCCHWSRHGILYISSASQNWQSTGFLKNFAIYPPIRHDILCYNSMSALVKLSLQHTFLAILVWLPWDQLLLWVVLLLVLGLSTCHHWASSSPSLVSTTASSRQPRGRGTSTSRWPSTIDHDMRLADIVTDMVDSLFFNGQVLQATPLNCEQLNIAISFVFSTAQAMRDRLAAGEEKQLIGKTSDF